MATKNSTRSTSATTDTPSVADGAPSFKTEVLALRAQLRCAFARLESVEGYGEPDQQGEALTDVGFALIAAKSSVRSANEFQDAMSRQLRQFEHASDGGNAA